MNLLRRLFEFLLGTGWVDLPPVTDQPLPNIISDCLRPAGDPRKMRHFFGRKDGRGGSCLRCGMKNPYGKARS